MNSATEQMNRATEQVSDAVAKAQLHPAAMPPGVSTEYGSTGPMHDRLHHLQGHAKSAYQRAVQKGDYWRRGVARFVRHKPMAALSIAGGIGVICGVIWKRL